MHKDTTTSPTPDFNAVEAYTFYEKVRHRLPKADFPDTSIPVDDILGVCDAADLFVFDAFGVLNVGEDPVPGASRQIQALRQAGKDVCVLTNGAGMNSSASFEKFRKLGYDFKSSEIFSSRQASELAATRSDSSSDPVSGDEILWGVIAREGFDENDLPFASCQLFDDVDDYDRVDAFLFLSSALWNMDRQLLLQNSLRSRARRVVIANPDVVAPHGANFSTEPGFFGHSLADAIGLDVEFHGKPFESVFQMVESSHSHIDPSRICMVGDTLHTDILGGCARGWKTLLVTDHGLFAGLNVNDFIEGSAIVPHFIVPTI